jgi:hypothetical protein
MNFAVELFLTALGMIYFIVIVAEVIWKLQANFGGDK